MTTSAIRSSNEDDHPVNRVMIFGVLSCALLMVSIDATIVATALHALEVGLGTSINWAGWTITAYLFGFVVMLPLSGRLCNQYGNRRVFLASVIAFTVTSLCCGLATNIWLLIGLRALQAGGGAGFTPSATALVVDLFGNARDRFVSLFGSIFAIGAMVGPIFGGLIVSYWSWRGVFFVNVPLGAAVIALSMRCIPRDAVRPVGARPRLDMVGLVWLSFGVVMGMFAASYVGEQDSMPFSPPFVILMVLSAFALTMFVHHIKRSPWPIIQPRLIYGSGFGAVNLVNGVFGGITSGVVALIPLYANDRYGIDALGSGTLLVGQSAAAIAFSIVVVLAMRRTGHRPPLYVGCIAIVAGVGLLSVKPVSGVSPFMWLAGAAFIVGAGSGAINPPSRNAGLQLAPDHAAMLASLRTMCMQAGTIATISVATALFTGSANPGIAEGWFYGVCALVLCGALPLISRVPEHHGSW